MPPNFFRNQLCSWILTIKVCKFNCNCKKGPDKLMLCGAWWIANFVFEGSDAHRVLQKVSVILSCGHAVRLKMGATDELASTKICSRCEVLIEVCIYCLLFCTIGFFQCCSLFSRKLLILLSIRRIAKDFQLIYTISERLLLLKRVCLSM